MHGFNIINLDKCSSTNTLLKEKKDSYPSYTVLRCKKQIKGKGRWGREWFSLTEKGLYFSILIHDIEHEEIRLFPLIITLALLRFFEELKLLPQYQWPNDIYIKGKKISGILSEGINKGEKTSLIIGVGININHNRDDFPEELRDKATSLKILKKRIFQTTAILKRILKLIEINMDGKETVSKLVLETEKFSRFKKGEKIIIKTRREKFNAVFIGYNNDGSIIIRREDKEENIYEGEVIKIEL